jgi:hypothetical protein
MSDDSADVCLVARSGAIDEHGTQDLMWSSICDQEMNGRVSMVDVDMVRMHCRCRHRHCAQLALVMVGIGTSRPGYGCVQLAAICRQGRCQGIFVAEIESKLLWWRPAATVAIPHLQKTDQVESRSLVVSDTVKTKTVRAA